MEIIRSLDPTRDLLTRRSTLAEAKADITAKAKRRASTPVPAEVANGNNIDARIGSLKILAQSLMRQIELLERDASVKFDAQAEVRKFEAELIRSALIRTGGKQRRAARLLGMKVTTLNTKIRRYHITLDNDPIVDDETMMSA